jgi:hypothetical protein
VTEPVVAEEKAAAPEPVVTHPAAETPATTTTEMPLKPLHTRVDSGIELPTNGEASIDAIAKEAVAEVKPFGETELV